jgi:KUP system potassium uptake protein
LFTRVAIDRFDWPPAIVYPVAVLFGIVDLGFLGANLFKIADGGWFPLLLGLIVFTIMTTWKTGRRLLAAQLFDGGLPLDSFLRDLDHDEVRRIPGTAVMLYSRQDIAPPAMLNTLRHFGALHERIIILTIVMSEAPHVPQPKRIHHEDLEAGFEDWTITYGYRDRISVPEELATTIGKQGGVDPDRVSYFLGRESVVATDHPGMAEWRERMFGLMIKNATDAASFFDLPADRTTTMGQTVEI